MAPKQELTTRRCDREMGCCFHIPLGLLFVILLGLVIALDRQILIFRDGTSVPLQQSVQRDYNVLVPEFDLATLNMFCGLDIPASAFTQCSNKILQSDGSTMIAPVLHILGERHSGTNLAATLIQTNFALVYNKTLVPIDDPYPQMDFGINHHKHNMQFDEGYYNGISVISVRNPYDWVAAMKKKCYYCGSTMESYARQGLIEKMVDEEWKEGHHERPYMFHDIFDLRQRKFCNQLKVAATRTDCVVLVRAEDNLLYHQQEKFIWRIQQMTGWKLRTESIVINRGYQGFSRDNNERDKINLPILVNASIVFKPQLTPMDIRTVKAANSRMNDTFEKALGYYSMHVTE